MKLFEMKLKRKIELITSVMQKKGVNKIETINLTSIENSPCDFFVICNGKSNRQIQAIAKGIEEKTLEKLKLKAWQKEGLTSNWILLDYIDIVVHVFKPEERDFYNLTDLWGDAIINTIKN